MRAPHLTKAPGLRALAAALIGLALAGPAAAQSPDLAAASTRAVNDVIIPAYRALAQAAKHQAQAMDRLCTATQGEALDAARNSFAGLVDAWSAVEAYRFGPVKKANRFERLMFWPDRRGRGLKQVRKIVATKDPTASSATTLVKKSVAVQGLLALEFVLFGTGSDSLAAAGRDGFRCAYGKAIAGTMAATADAVVADWTGADGYGALIQAPGDSNPVYRSHGEAIQELLRAAGEQLQIVIDLKLTAALGDSASDTKPKSPPFWRSGLVLANISGNVAGIRALHDRSGLADLLPRETASSADTLAFELDQAERALASLLASDADWAALPRTKQSRDTVAYLRIPLKGAKEILTEHYPAEFGLTLGFNSLDGD